MKGIHMSDNDNDKTNETSNVNTTDDGNDSHSTDNENEPNVNNAGVSDVDIDNDSNDNQLTDELNVDNVETAGVKGSGLPLLVGVDGSEASYKATWWAANYAAHSNLPLRIICCFNAQYYGSMYSGFTSLDDSSYYNEDMQEILQKAKGIAVEQGVPSDKVYTYAVNGDPSAVLVELSQSCDLIVIGNRGKGGLAERILGTSSSIVPAKSSCPVVVVPYCTDDGSNVHLNSTIKNVIVASDETAWGKRAVELAADLADGWSAKLRVVSAIPNENDFKNDPDSQALIVSEFKDELDNRLNVIRELHPDTVINGEVKPGSLLKTMLKYSQGRTGEINSPSVVENTDIPEHSADIIVVGSRGAGGLTGLILGSMSQGLIQHSNIPVYVVPKKFVNKENWRAHRTGDMRADVDALNEQADITITELDVKPAGETTVNNILTDIDSTDDSHDSTHADNVK